MEDNTTKTISPIYELIKAEVDRRGNLLMTQMIDPWIFFNSSGVKIKKSNGKMISISGVEFSGSAELAFWDGFVNEELTLLSLSLFEYTRANGGVRHVAGSIIGKDENRE